MAYYAADGQISQDPIEGGIEITDEQYREALNGMTEGQLVTVVDGVLVVAFPVEPEPEPEPEPTADEVTTSNIIRSPNGLFGGPTLRDIFNGY